MLMNKECVCGQKMEFEADDVERINCPRCGKKVSELFEGPVQGSARKEEAPARAKGLFLIAGDETKGPYSLKQVRAMYESGQFTMDTPCCREGDDVWRPLVDLEDEILGAEKKKPLPNIPAVAPTPINIQVQAPRMAPMGKSRALFVVLGLFLGLLGIHNFYAGYSGKGVAQLLVTLLTGWLLFPLFIVGVWALVEICAVDEDARGVRFS